MRKSILLFSLFFCTGMVLAQDWISFTQPDPQSPIISLVQSDNTQVQFTVEVCGMFKTDIIEGIESFQRLSIPAAASTRETGEPELPYIRQLIAIPECDNVSLSVNITGQTSYNNYNIYPAPDYIEVQNPDSTVYMQEVYTKNTAVYAQNTYLPGINSEIASTGYIRGQKYAEIFIYPLQFNPVTQHINVYTNYQLTLSFTNPASAVNVNTGIFNNIACNTLLNYTSSGIRASINDNMQGNGNVQWITLTSPLQADNIVADYLIICAEPFFEPNNVDSEVLRIANHRATYNGFDVAIINVEDILLLNFEYTLLDYIHEQKIRSCICRIYEGENAQHTYDGKLGYVLLIGDNEHITNLGMPSSFEYSDLVYPSDYYYSCVTNDNGIYDYSGDLFIGRFCVDNNDENGLTELHNIVEKTIYFESEYSFGIWRNNVAHANGNSYAPTYFSPLYYDFISNLLFEENLVIKNWYLLNEEIYQPVIDMINAGTPIMLYDGHGEYNSWQDDLNISNLIFDLANSNNFPYVTSRACKTGWFDNGNGDCLGEALTTYSDDKGFVGFLGAARVHMHQTNPTSIETPPTRIQERIPYCIWHDLSFITGEFILETMIGMDAPGTAHLYNYFGDPALNIMADGFEITNNLTPDCSSNLTISDKIYIRSGASLTIPADCKLYFEDDGMLIIDEGGSLIINQNATIYGTEIDNAILVSGNITINSNVEFNSLQSIIWEGLVFQNENEDYSFTYNFTMQNCGISGYASSLTIDPTNGTSYFINSDIEYTSGDLKIKACDFTNSTIAASDPLSQQSDVIINDCNFTNSDIKSGASIFIDGYDSYLITENIIDFADGDAISIFNATHYSEYNLVHKIKDNEISYSGTKTTPTHKAIEIYNSIAEIETNRLYDADYGIAAMNNSLVKIIGDENAGSISETQHIKDNTRCQTWFRNNSFPTYFHYNVIENYVNNNVYISNDYTPPLGEYLDIEDNCFDNNFSPTVDLIPSGAYDYLPYRCPTKSITITTNVENLYDSACSEISAGNYSIAESIFRQIISNYPQSIQASSSVKSLFGLENLTDSNYVDLKMYYETEPNLQSDTVLNKVSSWMTAHCNTHLKNYLDAISFFESIILNPDTITDSTFAIIDLGYVYLAMEKDSLSDNYIVGKLPQYIPKSYKQYETYRQYLIDLLLIDESALGIEDQYPLQEKYSGYISYFKIVPNPVVNSAELKFSLKENVQVKIYVTDITGSNQQILVDQMMHEGNHELIFNAEYYAKGIYFISIYTNGVLEATEKLIIN